MHKYLLTYALYVYIYIHVYSDVCMYDVYV